MAEFKFSCAHCGQHLQCDERAAGRQIQCPNCKQLIRIPPAPGKTAQYQPESGKTWATFVSSGREAPPPNLRLEPKPTPLKKPEEPGS